MASIRTEQTSWLLQPDLRTGWVVCAWIGLLFLIVGGVESTLLWIPFSVGNIEWEVGTVSRFYDTIAPLGLGLTFLIAAGRGLGWLWRLRLVAILALIVAVFMVVGSILYVTDLPQTFKATRETIIALPVRKAILKALVQSLIYPFAFIWLAVAGLRALKPPGRGASGAA